MNYKYMVPVRCLMNTEYKVKIKIEREKDIYLSVTHNGYQWASINIKNDKYEIPLIISALQRHLSNVKK